MWFDPWITGRSYLALKTQLLQKLLREGALGKVNRILHTFEISVAVDVKRLKPSYFRSLTKSPG